MRISDWSSDVCSSYLFAVFSSMFFMVMMVALDFGMYLTYQLRLNAAVEQGSMLAFNNRNAIDAQQIDNYVAAASRLPGGTVTVDVECNGSSSCTNTSRQCACLSADGQSFAAAASCGAVCPSGATRSEEHTSDIPSLI